MSTDGLIELPLENAMTEFPDFVEQNWVPLVSFDGIPLLTYRIRTSNPKALLFYFHGYLSCSLEFVQLGEEMAKEGIECFALDHRGHGQSGGMKGLFTDFDHLVEDATNYVHKVKEQYGDLPVFLAGASMGGAITINVSERITSVGMALLAPAVGIYMEMNCCLSMLLNCFVCCCPRSLLPRVGPRPALSRNTKALEAFRDSPLSGFGINRAVAVKSLFVGIENTFNKARSIKTPFVIIQGGNDFVTSEPRAKAFYETAGAQDKDYWLFPEMHHCVHIEPEFPDIMDRLKRWFKNRLN